MKFARFRAPMVRLGIHLFLVCLGGLFCTTFRPQVHSLPPWRKAFRIGVTEETIERFGFYLRPCTHFFPGHDVEYDRLAEAW
mgnify:CR=1 FL=1